MEKNQNQNDKLCLFLNCPFNTYILSNNFRENNQTTCFFKNRISVFNSNRENGSALSIQNSEADFSYTMQKFVSRFQSDRVKSHIISYHINIFLIFLAIFTFCYFYLRIFFSTGKQFLVCG